MCRGQYESCVTLWGAFAAKYLTYLETHPNEPYVIIHLYRCLKIGLYYHSFIKLLFCCTIIVYQINHLIYFTCMI